MYVWSCTVPVCAYPRQQPLPLFNVITRLGESSVSTNAFEGCVAMVTISMVSQGVPMLMEYTVLEDTAHSRQSLRDKRVSCRLCLNTSSQF